MSVYNIAKYQSEAGINYISDNIMILLVNTTFLFIPSNKFVSDIVSSECSGTNYFRQSLQNKTVVQNDFLNKAIFSADPVSWNFIDVGPVNAAVIYKHITNDSDSMLIASFTISPANYVTGGGIFTIKWSNNGILTID